MEESTLQLISVVAQTMIAVLALVASIAIPLRIRNAQRRRETLDFIHAVRTMWISIDSVVVQDDELLKIADSVLAPGSEALTPAERKKNWISLMVLNAIYMDYLGVINGFHSKQGLKMVRHSLRTLLVDDGFYHLTQSRAYDDGFRELCQEVRKALTVTGAPTLTGTLGVQ
ncbi:hypothetical protein [Silanimonas sp.]|uniref:hypothetical protein n=1 Tax=Silanimonas sp. TaxID=1929290 RepID=UPI001BC59000|nr:hypothetical protein [Silanimonas sp.]MBS3896358.1 hypothetical protein [Silanimonas sp.]